MKPYTLSYTYAGKRWAVDILAESMEDAERRVEAMRRSMELDGEVVFSARAGN